MIVLKFAHQLVLERNPLNRCSIARPAAGTAGSLAAETRRIGAFFRDQRLQNALQLLAVRRREAGAESDVIELAALVVEAQQQGADFLTWLLTFSVRPAEAAHYAIGGTQAFDLYHAGALARHVYAVEPLHRPLLHPFLGHGKI